MQKMINFFNNINYDYSNPCAIEVGIRIAISDTDNRYISLYSYDKNGDRVANEYVNYGIVQVKFMIELASKLGLEKGKYKCYPAYKKDNKWYDFKVELPISPLYINLIVKDNGSIVFTTPDVRNTAIKVEDKTICIEENCMNADVHIFNIYGLCVFSGREDKIKVPSAGIYTVKIGENFYKTLIVE
ncbi:MAG: hypothetical protein K2M11_02915 [Paramuribaculum sp.]|nr:hypothetical protein [Paramuribaculum sp.]